MTELTTELAVEQTVSLIRSYAFDLGRSSTEKLLQKWLAKYHSSWIRLATIEALYLGRYKAISIEQIMNVWLRLGSPNTHFTHEFERLICRKLPNYLIDPSDFSTQESTSNSVNNSFRYDNNGKTITHSPTKRDLPEVKRTLAAPSTTRAVSGTESTVPKQSSPPAAPAAASTANESSRVNESESSHANSKPKTLVSASEIPDRANWTGYAAEQSPIHQFVPMPDVSDFYTKLKALGQKKLEEQ